MGKLITFEGIDGSGKTSIIEGVKEQLTSKGYSVITLQEPGGTVMGETIRDLIKSDIQRHETTDMFLFFASRNDMVRHALYPAIGIYDFVLLDRYVDSTVAYQGYGLGRDIAFIDTINRQFLKTVRIDKTIYVDVDLDVASQRRKLRGERPDKYEDDAFLERVKDGYEQIIKTNPDRFFIVENNDNLSDSINLVTKAILNVGTTDITRQKLQEHEGKELVLRATAVRPGRRQEDTPTLLLKDVHRKYSSNIICDHAWVDYTREVVKAGTIAPGDGIEFKATIKRYKKYNHGEYVEEIGLSEIKDVKVVKPTKLPETDDNDEWVRNDLAYINNVTDETLFNELLSRYVRFITAMLYKYYNTDK
jgi:dTMP kinase